MAAPAVIIKAAVTVLTDKKLFKIVGGIVLGIIIVIMIPIVILTSVIGDAKSIDWDSPEIKQQIIDNMTDEQKAQMLEFETIMISIENEIKSQQMNFDPIKAQVIYLCALAGKEKDNPAFYTDYISCYAQTQNDSEIFANITSKFNVSFTDDEKQKIVDLYTKAIELQKMPPNGIHIEIGKLLKEDTTPLSEGDFLSPFHGLDWKTCLTSQYGKRMDPITGQDDVAHTGIDLAAPFGTAIYASKPGKVLFVRYDENGYGNYLAVNHGGGYVTLYGHCSEILVSESMDVFTDTVIAKVGSTGKSTGNHCHFEVIVKGQPENPKRYMEVYNP